MKDYLIFGIFLFIYRKKKTTALEIAKKFEISRRTVYRYIEEICKAGIPLQTQQGANGGISIDKNYKLE